MSDDTKPTSIGSFLRSFDSFGAWAPGQPEKALVIGKDEAAKKALREEILRLDNTRRRRIGRR